MSVLGKGGEGVCEVRAGSECVRKGWGGSVWGESECCESE